MKADLVFEGGGVKGIGLVGAYSVIEAQGFTPANVAGTSAGAIVASLVAAGYSAAELREEMNKLDYKKFEDPTWLTRIPVFGAGLSVLAHEGIFAGDFAEAWIRELLARKGKRTFGDLQNDDPTGKHPYKLAVIATDLTNERMAVLPDDLGKHYGVDPNSFDIAKAVRMSMSIPFFFEPVKLGDMFFVDGGVLSNFPIGLFDCPPGVEPQWPTFGVRLVGRAQEDPIPLKTPIDFGRAIVRAMLEAHDKAHIENDEVPRTIMVGTDNVHATDFGLSRQKRDELFANGTSAAKEFFETWDWGAYKRRRLGDKAAE